MWWCQARGKKNSYLFLQVLPSYSLQIFSYKYFIKKEIVNFFFSKDLWFLFQLANQLNCKECVRFANLCLLPFSISDCPKIEPFSAFLYLKQVSLLMKHAFGSALRDAFIRKTKEGFSHADRQLRWVAYSMAKALFLVRPSQ